jgi:hypothetical protein
MDKGINITQALNSSNEIGPPKTKAGRRYIPVGSEALSMAKHYAKKHGSEEFVFAVRNAEGHQQYRHFLRSGWHVLMDEAGFVTEEKRGGKKVLICKWRVGSFSRRRAGWLK